MKIFKRLLTVVFALGLVVGLSGFNLSENNGAGIQEGFGCGVFDGYGNVHYVVDEDNISVINHGGNTIVICHAEGLPTPGFVVKQNGFLCGTFNGTTSNTTSNVSAEGDSLLKCMIKKEK